MAPHWREQKGSWAEAAVLFKRLLLPATWLCDTHKGIHGGMAGIPFPPAALRLLTSSVATAAKAAQLTGVDMNAALSSFTALPAVWNLGSLKAATAVVPAAYCMPAIAALLLPRILPSVAALPEGPAKFLAVIAALESAVNLAKAVDPELHSQQPFPPPHPPDHAGVPSTLSPPSPFTYAMSTPVLRMLSSCHVLALAHHLAAQIMAGAAVHTIPGHQSTAMRLAIGSLGDYVRMMVSEQWARAVAIGDNPGAPTTSSALAVEASSLSVMAAEAPPSAVSTGPSPQAELRDMPAPSSQVEESWDLPGPSPQVVPRDQPGPSPQVVPRDQPGPSPQVVPRDQPGPSPQAELRALLGWMVPSLLDSPLLDFLMVTQHVVVAARPSAQKWSLTEAAIPQVHLMPESMDPDALDSKVAMQVGPSRRYIHPWI